MSACQDYEELLTLHAAGALEPAEEARVRAHLETCAACQRELRSTAGLLSQVALPPPSPAEQARLEALPQRTLGRWRREQVRRAMRMRTVGALMASAAAVLLVLTLTLPGEEAPPALTPLASPEAPSETQEAFEQWASADPLAEEVLEPEWAEDAVEEGEEAEEDLPVSELFLDPYPGDTL